MAGCTIGQVVAEVESHVRETGEDPIEAFGQPATYSAMFASDRGTRARRARAILVGAAVPTVAIIGGLMILESLSSLTGVVRVTANMALFWVATGLVFALVMRWMENLSPLWLGLVAGRPGSRGRGRMAGHPTDRQDRGSAIHKHMGTAR